MNDAQQLAEIKTRWVDWKTATRPFCRACVTEAIRHYDRNMAAACIIMDETAKYDASIHPGRYDGEILAHSALDIWRLIDMIERAQ